VTVLTTERLWLLPLTRRLMLDRLTHNDFRTMVGTPEPREVHVGPDWPGDALPAFPVWAASMRSDDDTMTGTYMVVARDTAEAVGMVGVKGGPDTNGAQEIGYGMNPDACGRGYATEAVRALVVHLLASNGIRAVTAYTATGNLASQRVLEKLGFTRTGTAWNEEDGDLIAWSIR
jgi:[ribosomal protein S5]-alanine N-acetyltransferase